MHRYVRLIFPLDSPRITAGNFYVYSDYSCELHSPACDGEDDLEGVGQHHLAYDVLLPRPLPYAPPPGLNLHVRYAVCVSCIGT